MGRWVVDRLTGGLAQRVAASNMRTSLVHIQFRGDGARGT